MNASTCIPSSKFLVNGMFLFRTDSCCNRRFFPVYKIFTCKLRPGFLSQQVVSFLPNRWRDMHVHLFTSAQLIKSLLYRLRWRVFSTNFVSTSLFSFDNFIFFLFSQNFLSKTYLICNVFSYGIILSSASLPSNIHFMDFFP